MTVATRSRIVFLVSALAASALALSACAPAAPVHTKAPGSHQHAAPPSPTPTPTPTVVAAPSPLVETTCSTLAPLAVAKQITVANNTKATTYPSTGEPQQDANFSNAALLQLGGIGCYWAGGPMGDGGSEAGLVIEVLPNASTAFAAAATQLLSTDDVHEGLVATEPKWGSASYSDCESADSSAGDCTFDILIGSYWLHIEEIPASFSGKPYPFKVTQKSFLTNAVAAVTALPAPGTAWPVPADAAKLPTTCGALLSTAQVVSVLGVKAKAGVAEFDGEDPFDFAAAKGTNLGGCYWQGRT